MYYDYQYSIFDALNWMIQTGGNINFWLQTRVTTDPYTSVEEQKKVLGKFIDAKGLMDNASKMFKEVDPVSMPKFFIGSTEWEVDTVTDIYESVEGYVKDRTGNTDMLGGIYYGKEDPETNVERAKALSEYIKAKGSDKQLIWIPYMNYDENGNNTSIANIEEMIDKGFFDTVIIQPGVFYSSFDEKLANQRFQDVASIINYSKGKTTKVGMELEFDMGLITGRTETDNENYITELSVTPEQKQQLFKMYLDAVKDYIGTDPVGIYSGGPNEQGYSNILGNSNKHNNGNHKPYINAPEGVNIQDDLEPYNGKAYDEFPGAYSGNLIYDINSYLFKQTNVFPGFLQ